MMSFDDEIAVLLKNIHKGTRHVGKVPSRAAASAVTHRLETLRTDLAKAIDDENFEDAARLRDEINRLAQDSPRGVTDPSGR